ncbi:MAG: hypothetical protein CVU11_09995 [Bacteroidetes bacterium HGW-Bacteroidetes-6]|jgi:hypothetical protein|nr:MAG: hypothetical protein CVU11_09995 [Bacteroidetes bacterium HGW-Bacteroidetes-6]
MKKILFGLCLLLVSSFIQAQKTDSLRKLDASKFKSMSFVGENSYLDSIRIFGYGFQVVLKTAKLEWLTDSALQLNTLIEDFQRVYAAQRNQFPEMTRYRLTYSYYFPNIIKEELDTSVGYFYQPSSERVRRLKSENECVIKSPGVNIIIQFSNDSILLDSKLASSINGVLALKTSKEWARTSVAWATTLSKIENSEKYSTEVNPKITYTKKDESSLELHLSTGLLYANISPSIFAEIKGGYVWNNYGYDIGYYLSYDWNFTFGENGTRYINSFINLSAVEEGFLPKLKTMAGIDMGYLIFRQGDIFEKNTFRLGFGFKGDFFYFSPQIYFPGSFNGVYPGLRVCIGI